CFFQKAHEIGDVGRQRMLVEPAQAYVEKISLAKAPAIPFHVRAEVEFRNRPADRTRIALPGIHFKLHFLRSDSNFLASVGAQESRDWAEMPAGANDEPRLNLAITIQAPPERSRVFSGVPEIRRAPQRWSK